MKDPLTPLHTTGIYITEIPANGTPLNIKYPDNLIQIDKEFYEILGTITPDNISFDPAPYLERVTCRYDVPQRVAGFLDVECFRNYSVEKQYGNAFGCFKENAATASFRSLLTSCGIELANKLHLSLIKK